MTKFEIKALAQKLYLRSNKTQKQIAEQVGVSDRTIRYWIQQEEWDVIRYRMDHPPSTHTECISMQLTCLQKRILARDSGIPTMQEAMLMHKLIMCMTRLNQIPALNQTVNAPSYLYTSPEEYDLIPPEEPEAVSTAYSGQTANDGSQTAPGEEDLKDISSLPFPFRMILAKEQGNQQLTQFSTAEETGKKAEIIGSETETKVSPAGGGGSDEATTKADPLSVLQTPLLPSDPLYTPGSTNESNAQLISGPVIQQNV